VNYEFKIAKTTCDVFVKGMNLTNEQAREHTSFLKDQLPLPGRGLVVGMQMKF
jgi:iron complex outermembrane receptor protein